MSRRREEDRQVLRHTEGDTNSELLGFAAPGGAMDEEGGAWDLRQKLDPLGASGIMDAGEDPVFRCGLNTRENVELEIAGSRRAT